MTTAHTYGYAATGRSTHQDWKSPALRNAERALEAGEEKDREYEAYCNREMSKLCDGYIDFVDPDMFAMMDEFDKMLMLLEQYKLLAATLHNWGMYWTLHRDDCECTPEPRERTCTYCHQRKELERWAKDNGYVVA